QVILTGDVSGGSRGGRIFRSSDFGRSFTATALPFHPLAQLSYHPRAPHRLLALSTQNGLWVSKDFGETWEEIHKAVCLAKWGANDTIFFTTYLNNSCKADLGLLELKKTSDFGKTSKVIATKVYSFGLGGRFLFASVMTEKGTTRRIHVSLDQGETWNMAQLPSVGHEQFYSILAANDDLVFMHVDEPGDTGYGTIYTSDDRGIVYSKSLERHLYTTTGGETDFTNVTSLRGIYITSVLSEDNSIQSVITFDRGGEWVPLRRPKNSSCDSTARSRDECSLHIHASYSISQKLNVPMAPLSEPNAVGIVIAHGTDPRAPPCACRGHGGHGGHGWTQGPWGPCGDTGDMGSRGPWGAMGDRRSPQHGANAPPRRFSTDEGQCWYQYRFCPEPIFFTGLASEPGARSMTVSVWGTVLSRQWVSYTIDFSHLLSRTCEGHRGDTAGTRLGGSQGLAGAGGANGDNWGWGQLGLVTARTGVTKTGDNWDGTARPSVCPCTLGDFLCDFGYYRPENHSECVEQPELRGHDLEFCLYGRRELLRTSGYRKIPGDKCSGGESPSREEKDMKLKCTSTFLGPGQLVVSPSSTPIVLAVVAVLLVAVVAGVLLVKK
ncbi:SORT protein, partial [Aegotheles bennettii]|nr:SORT protein [Aegotheles bennettii]